MKFCGLGQSYLKQIEMTNNGKSVYSRPNNIKEQNMLTALLLAEHIIGCMFCRKAAREKADKIITATS